MSTAATVATPLMLYAPGGRSVVVSPKSNFFVGVHSSTTTPGLLQAGLKASLRSIPANFTHETIISSGHGAEQTLVSFGDQLLAVRGKARVDPYKDYMLSHLGHWNDAGSACAFCRVFRFSSLRHTPLSPRRLLPTHTCSPAKLRPIPPLPVCPSAPVSASGYFYHNKSPYKNYEQALLAVKADAESRRIPYRYSQVCACYGWG